ncbi:MAG: geranylgeranylglyceryl/heptaprenylglyceryl phosphate synthase [bacterium]
MTPPVCRYNEEPERDAEAPREDLAERADPPRGSLAVAERFLRGTSGDGTAADDRRESGDDASYRAPRPARIAGLIDPDRTAPDEARAVALALEAAGFDLILLGTSVSRLGNEDAVARALHRATSLPLVLFPGGADQLTPHADALLFLTLLSGRNPRYLIGEQVRAARRVRDLRLPAIPTAYILVSGGRVSTVERVTGTSPIAGHDVASLVDHALAAEMLGLRAIYLEAGSGAERTVPPEALREVRAATRVPILAGGGIRTPDACAALAAAGADTLVVGTLIEEGADPARLRELAAAAHGPTAREAHVGSARLL